MTYSLVAERQRDRWFDHLTIAAVYIFVVGGLVLRARSGADIQSDPADGAAAFRIAMDAVAGVLVVTALLGRAVTRVRRSQTAPVTLVTYGLYTIIAALGLLVAVPAGRVLTAFRVFEMVVMIAIAIAGTWRLDIDRILWHIERVIYLYVALVGVGLAVSPSTALFPQAGGILPFRLQGAFPQISTDSVGTFGVMLFGLGLARRSHRYVNVSLGVVLVLLSQYRTGYAACAALIFVFLLLHRSVVSRAVAVLLLPVVAVVLQSSTFSDAWSRGENSADSFGGRTDLWNAAFNVAQRDPLLGTGLSSGFRYEVQPLIAAGYSDDIGSVHNTWVEAYLGTGWLGTIALGAFMLAALIFAWRIRDRTLAPILLVVALIVRQFAGSTVELPGWLALVSLMLFGAVESNLRGRTRGTQMMNGESWLPEATPVQDPPSEQLSSSRH